MVTRKSKKSVVTAAPSKAKKVEDSNGRREQVKAIDFVPIFQSCETTEEVAEHFGREPLWVSSFASRLRKMGVNLKKMKRSGGGGKRIDVDELNALIEG